MMGKHFEPYANVEPSYLTGSAPVLRGFSMFTRGVYLALWGIAFSHKRDTIEVYHVCHEDEFDPKNAEIDWSKMGDFARDIGVDSRSLSSSLRCLVQRGLINVALMQHGCRILVAINVVGCGLKHSKLKWNESFLDLHITSHHILKEHRAAPASEKSSEPPEKPKRSVRQQDQDRDIEDLRAAYAARFPKAPALSESELGEILKGCKLREISPAGLLESIAPHVQKPMGMVRGYLRGEYPIRDGVPSWYEWCIRHNRDMKHISEMLTERKAV